MKYKYLILLIFLLIISFSLCGCHSMREGIRIFADLPKQTQIHILLPMNITEQATEGDSEIKRYNSDSFYCADEWLDGSGIYSEKFMFAEYESFPELREYVSEYKELKIAVTDSDGNILKVSSAFQLIDKNYFYDEISYDYETNSINGIAKSVLDESNFMNLLKWTLISFFSMILLNIAEVVLISLQRKNILRFVCPVLWIIMSIPVYLMIFFQCREFFNDYYVSDNWTLKDSIIWMVICDLPYIFNTIGMFVLWITVKKKQ